MNDDKPLDPWIVVIGVAGVVILAVTTLGAFLFG